MSRPLWLRNVGVRIAQTLGTRIVDQRTGEVIGRGFFVAWRGKIHVIGLEKPMRVVWLPQKRITYWKQEIGFASHPPVDFPNVRGTRNAETNESTDHTQT